jgi:hypothetical protein
MALSLSTACTPATFGLPVVFGAKILSMEANLVTNYTTFVPDAYRFTQPSVAVQDANFCNVTVSYTHPGQGDKIFVEAWLPVDNWNGRFQAVGGGGWVAGRFAFSRASMAGAIADGYATITTDAGLGDATDAQPWALLSPGNVNLYNLQNLGSVSLNDEVYKAPLTWFRKSFPLTSDRLLSASLSFGASTVEVQSSHTGMDAHKVGVKV